MPDDASPRPRLVRRLLIAMARAAGLLILVVGINGVLGIAVPRLEDLARYAISLVLGVILFESLRPGPRRDTAAPVMPAIPTDETATAELAEARSIIEGLRAETQRMRDQSLERETEFREQIARLDETIAEERAAGEEIRARESRLREQYGSESEHLQRTAGRALEELQQSRAAVDELRAQVDKEKKRADEAHRQLETTRKAAEAQRVSAAQDAEKVRSGFERERQRADEASRDLDAARKAIEEQHASALKESEKLRAESQRERQRADQAVRELQNAISSMAGVATQRQKMEAQLAESERRLASAVQEIETLRSERQRVDTEKRELQRSLEKAAAGAATTREAAQAEAKSANEALESERRRVAEAVEREHALQEEIAAVRKNIADLTAGHEGALGAARAEAKSANEALESERRRMAEAVEREHALQEEIAAVRKSIVGLTAGHDKALADVTAERDAARAEAKAAGEEIASLRASAVDEKAQRESIDAQWSAKLNKIVTGLATDHENDLGEAIAAREAAKAEARSLGGRVAGLQDEIAALKDRLAKIPVVDEQQLRHSIETEWSAKLQTIVNHMATDHDADVGKAIEEREAARAESRSLSMKVGALQAKLQQVELELTAIRSVPPPIPELPPLPVTNEDEQRARAEVLQFAEQAHDALKRSARRGRILFVHHDPSLRTMWSENLGKSGFEVQTAADGLEGLRLAIAGKPDVVIADSSTPKMGGRELCQLIKSNPETTGVKVLLMTGVYTTEVPIDSAAQEFEADEMLRKPVKYETLKAALSNLLDGVTFTP